jgi:hypothetical protein
MNPQQFLDSTREATRYLKRMKSYAPDPQSQNKYSRTIDWLENHVFDSLLRAV